MIQKKKFRSFCWTRPYETQRSESVKWSELLGSGVSIYGVRLRRSVLWVGPRVGHSISSVSPRLKERTESWRDSEVSLISPWVLLLSHCTDCSPLFKCRVLNTYALFRVTTSVPLQCCGLMLLVSLMSRCLAAGNFPLFIKHPNTPITDPAGPGVLIVLLYCESAAVSAMKVTVTLTHTDTVLSVTCDLWPGHHHRPGSWPKTYDDGVWVHRKTKGYRDSI